jgi:hypothetical protein
MTRFYLNRRPMDWRGPIEPMTKQDWWANAELRRRRERKQGETR